MKKLLIAGLILVGISAHAHTFSTVVNGDIGATGLIIPDMVVSEVQKLDFGVMLPYEKHDTRVSSGLADQGVNAIVLVNGDPTGSNTSNVAGVQIKYGTDTSVILTNGSGSGNFTADLYHTDSSTSAYVLGNGGPITIATLDSAGKFNFEVGGAMTTGSAVTGRYNGTFKAYAQYDAPLVP